MVFKTDSARLVNEVVPESFRFGSEHFKEVTNVHGSGIFHRFEHNGIINIIYVIVQADRGTSNLNGCEAWSVGLS